MYLMHQVSKIVEIYILGTILKHRPSASWNTAGSLMHGTWSRPTIPDTRDSTKPEPQPGV